MSSEIKLTEPQFKALVILSRYKDGITAKAFAKQMWPDSSGWRTLSDVRKGVVRGKAMPGLAGRFLLRLRSMGFVIRPYSGRYQSMWALTVKGNRAIIEHRKMAADGRS